VRSYKAKYPAEAAAFERVQSGKLPEGWAAALPTYTPADKALATRQLSQAVLERVVPAVPEFIGGSADLTPSNLTKVAGNKVSQCSATIAAHTFASTTWSLL
jgi:transketolase